MTTSRLDAAKAYLAERNLTPSVRQPGASRVLGGWIGPEAKRRVAANARAFAAARLDRLTDSWRATSERINDELRTDLDALIRRSRELESNNDYAQRYLQMVETNVVGDAGPRLISLADNAPGNPDQLARDAIERAWKGWLKRGVCEISGTQSGIEVMWQIVRGTARDGDYIIEEIRGQAAGNAYGYALRLIDVTRLATWYNREPAAGVNAIRMGIEIDYYGRAVRYWFADTRHSAPQPVSAQNIIHRFRGIRPEQVRGIPWMHASMLSMHFVGEFALSALVAAKHGADHLGFFVSPDGDPQAPLLDGDTDERGRTITTSAPGTYDTLPMGYDVKTVDSKYPNEVFDPFVKSANRRMASGLNVSYPALCNDHADLNYNSIRATQSDDRDQWRKVQAWFREAWLETIFDSWLTMALASGAIRMPSGSPLPMAKREKFAAHAWQFRGWQSNDPLKDVQAFREELELHVNSRTRYTAERGREFDDVAREIALEAQTAPTPAPAATLTPDPGAADQ